MLYFQECIVEIYFCKVLTADPLKTNYEPKGNPPMNPPYKSFLYKGSCPIELQEVSIENITCKRWKYFI